MTTPFSLRSAVQADLETLTDIWHVGWAEAHAVYVPAALVEQRTRESFRIRLDNMLASTSVGEVNGRVVGFCCTKPHEIYQMYVSSEARGTGIAAALIEDGERRLKDNGSSEVFLDVILENDRAIAFYRKQGWDDGTVEVAELDTLGDPFLLKLRRMRKTL